jgi:uncharacterized protein (TIGR03435 family)
MTLQGLISFAFGRGMEVQGPSWLREVRVDIHAIPPVGSTRAQIPAMLQTLLAERFGLVAHVESRPAEVMLLTVADGGVRMKEVQAVNDLETPMAQHPDARIDSTGGSLNGSLRMLITAEGAMRTVTERSMYDQVPGKIPQAFELNAIRMSMQELAAQLALSTGERVVDQTGLTGLYQFRIALPRGGTGFLQRAGIVRNAQGDLLSDPSGISPAKSVETLGLKLEKKRIPLDILVVDKVERTPKEN